MSFQNIVGHENVIQALESALHEDKVGHAYLFTGPEGIGKKTLIRSFAIALLCHRSLGDVECDCQSCRLIRSESHPDLITVTATGNSIKIEQLREMQRTLFLRPLLGKRKVFVFPETELLTEAAANSFLKLLEEPPPGIIFLFSAVRPDHILPTIRSRCQIFQLFPITADLIGPWLVAKGFPVAAARQKAASCQGIPGLALGEANPALAPDLIGLADVLRLDLLNMFKLSAEFEKKERQELLVILRHWEAEARYQLLQMGKSEPEALGGGPALLLVFILEQLAHIMPMIETNVNQRLALDHFLMAVKLFAA